MARTVERTGGILLPVHPLQLDVLKVIACICMLIDHINTCLLGRDYIWMYLVGRLAFPLFAICFVVTLTQENALRTAKRTAIAAVLVQPIYALAFANTGFSPWWAGNILFSFAAVAYLVELGKSPTISSIVQAVAVIMLASIIQAPSSFGLAGIAFMLALWFLLQGAVPWICVTVAGIAFLNLNPDAPVLAACLAVSLLAILTASSWLRGLQPRRWLHSRTTVGFYAGHLGVIASVCSLVNLV